MMGSEQILFGADGNDAGWVDFVVRHIVVTLNVIEVYRFGNARDLIKIA